MFRAHRANRPVGGDRGFGMSEVVVAMFMLALLAVAVLPLLIASAQLSTKNVTLATATQLMNEQMGAVRGLAATCSAISQFSNESLGLVATDPRGTVLRVVRSHKKCPDSYPGLVEFTALVSVDGSGQVLARATTSVFVTSAGPAKP